MPLPSPFCDERNMNRRILRLENTARHGVIEFFIHNTTQPGEILHLIFLILLTRAIIRAIIYVSYHERHNCKNEKLFVK